MVQLPEQGTQRAMAEQGAQKSMAEQSVSGAMAGQPPGPWPRPRSSCRPLQPDPYSPPQKIPWGKLGAYRPGWVLEEQALEPSLGWIWGLEPSQGWYAKVDWKEGIG